MQNLELATSILCCWSGCPQIFSIFWQILTETPQLFTGIRHSFPFRRPERVQKFIGHKSSLDDLDAGLSPCNFATTHLLAKTKVHFLVPVPSRPPF